PPTRLTLNPYTTLCRSTPAAPSGPSVSSAAPPIHLPISWGGEGVERLPFPPSTRHLASHDPEDTRDRPHRLPRRRQDHPAEPHSDRKSTRLNSSHVKIS